MTIPPQITQTSLMNALPVGIGVMVKGADGFEFQNANMRLRKMFNLTEQVSLNVLLGAVDGKAINDLSKTAGGETVIAKDGRWFSVNITSFENNEWLAVVKDVTDIKSEVQEAEALTEMKSHFLAMMSHEIRTPMQSIFGLLELISDEQGLNGDVQAMLATTKTSATGLLAILDDILDIAKVDAGKMELDDLEVPVRTLAYGVIECMEVKLQGSKVRLATEIDENVPPVITGDPTRLRQILLNLVGNAMKFTDNGEIRLKITTETQYLDVRGKNKFGLRFEIIDTGIGMSRDVAAKLFQPFTQADGSTTRKYGGTGLGLSICHKLVDLMRGKIGVTSEEGKGSTFWFEIPTESVSVDKHIELPDLNGLAILSVEDHPNGAKEIVRTLKSMNADVTSVPTYAEGLAMAKSRRYDVALIDQGLPDGLGIDLLKEISHLQPYAGLIMYTVRDDYGLQHSTRTLGAKYLSKPASRLGLGEAVRDAARQNISAIAQNRPKRLLIAEDTPAVRDVLRRQLNKLGVAADFVENGLQALEKIRKDDYGILFTDLHMPEMDGYEVIKRLRAMEEQEGTNPNDGFPVVVLTADVQMAQKQAYLSYGFNECLLKPVSLGQFKQLLIRWGIITEDEAAQVSDQDDPPAPDVPPSQPREKVFVSVAEPEVEIALVESSGIPTAKDSEAPAIDRQAVEGVMGGFDDNAKDMLRLFVEMTEPQLDILEKAYKESDLKNIAEIAHSLKGAARSACCLRLGDLADEVQTAAESGEKPSDRLIDDVIMEFYRVQREVASL